MLGAGSGVSTFAVSLAHQAGARVLVTSSSAEKIERARELGAEAGVDYTDGDWVDEVRELTGGEGVDVVVDSVGIDVAGLAALPAPGWSARRLRGDRRRDGRARGAADLLRPVLDPRHDHGQRARLRGCSCRRSTPADWGPVIDSVRPLAEAAAAHERLEAGDHFGKLVLEIA